MNEEAPRQLRGPDPDEGGGVWKWIAGAGLAAVLLGGGVYLWQAMSGPSQPAASEYAYDDPAPDALPAEPFESASLSDELDAAATADAADEPAPKAAAPRPRPRPTPAPAPEPIPEQVIGVGPIDLNTPVANPSAGTDADEIIVPAPRWVRQPTARRLSAAYPTRALERGREGEARIRCTVVEGGALDCVRLSETPGNAGFGRAALRVARMYRHAPVRADGSSAMGTPVDLRVIFRIADEPPRRG